MLHSGSIADRLVDLLSIDGGWLTCPGIAAALEANEASVHRTLYRLRRKELVEDRVVEMAPAGPKRKVDSRREWRQKCPRGFIR